VQTTSGGTCVPPLVEALEWASDFTGLSTGVHVGDVARTLPGSLERPDILDLQTAATRTLPFRSACHLFQSLSGAHNVSQHIGERALVTWIPPRFPPGFLRDSMRLETAYRVKLRLVSS